MIKYFRDYTKLPRTIYILLISRIINCIGAFVYPLLTILLTVKLGFSSGQAGIITTVSITLGGLSMLAGGKLADIIGRKKLIIISSLAGAAAFMSCAFLGTSRIIVLLLMAGNILNASGWPSIDAMVTDATVKENRQSAFSLLYMGTNAGIAIGPLLAGFLINEHLFWFFFLDALTTLISIVPFILFIKETKPTKEEIEAVPVHDNERAEKTGVLKALARRPVLLAFTFIVIIISFVYSQYTFGVPLYANFLFGNISGPRIYGSMMTINALMVVFLTMFVIQLAKKINPIINIIIGALLYGTGFGILFFVRNIYLLALSTIIWTMGEIIVTVNIEVFIANNSPITHRGRFFAMITFFQESGFALAPMLTGFFIASYGIKNVWPVVSGFAAIASFFMLLLFLFNKKRNKKIEASRYL